MMRNVLIAMGLAAALAMAGCHKNEEAPATDTPAMQDAAPAADAAAPAEQQAADAAAAAQSCTKDCGNGVTATIQCAAGETATCDCTADPKAKCDAAPAAMDTTGATAAEPAHAA